MDDMMNGVTQGLADPGQESTEMAGSYQSDVGEDSGRWGSGADAAGEDGNRAGMTDNQRWAIARKRAEREAKERLATQSREYDGLMSELREYGFQGTPSEIARMVRAQRQGLMQNDSGAYSLDGQRHLQERISALPDVQQAKRIVQMHTYEQDLNAVRAAYPEVEAKEISELGPVFVELMAAAEQGGKHLDPVIAYEVQMAYNKRNQIDRPPSTGSARGDALPEKEFFSSDELDTLSARQLDDPNIMAKAMKSLRKLRK